MLSRKRRQTIRAFAHDYFLRVSYVDIYGRNVGYDYDHILEEIKANFPNARTSKIWLRRMAYEITDRMPVRRRSRRALASDYAMSELLRTRSGRGISMPVIIRNIHIKFPGQHVSLPELRRMEARLRVNKFDVPERT